MSKKVLISEYVKGLRKSEGLNTRDFGRKYKISKAQVSKYENGKCDMPSDVVVTNFCNTFKIPLEEFDKEFEFDDSKTGYTIELIEHLRNRLGAQWSDYYCHNIAKAFYDKYEKKSNLSNFEKCDYFKEYEEADINDVYIDRAATCLSKNKKSIWICSYLRTPEFKSKPRNINYDYMLAEISTVACLPSKKLGCNNFVFITSNKGMFDYFTKLEFHSYDTNAYLAVTENSKTIGEIKQLYGKDDFLCLGKGNNE